MEAIIQVTDLPPEIIALILEYLDRRSINRFLTSSMKLNEIGAHPAISNVIKPKGTGILASVTHYNNTFIHLRLYRKSVSSKCGMSYTQISYNTAGIVRLKRLSNLLKSGKEIELKKLGEGYLSSSFEPELVDWVVLSPEEKEIVKIEIVRIEIDRIVLQRLLEESMKMRQNDEIGEVVIFDDRTVFKSLGFRS